MEGGRGGGGGGAEMRPSVATLVVRISRLENSDFNLV